MNLNIQPMVEIKPVLSIQGWQKFFNDGEAFLKTGSAAYEKGKKAFTPETLYNIIAMAIEKFVMAALMQRGTMPDNHTMADLAEAMEKIFPDDVNEIKKELLQMDRYQEICDMDSFKISPPSMDEIPLMIETATKLKLMVYNNLPKF